jgi:hypothetical protein
MSARHTFIVLAIVVATGCFDDDDDCVPYAYDVAENLQRDPYSGQCQSFGGGGYCNDSCEPCALGAPEEYRDWAQCYTACESLAEAACKSTPGCRAAYAGDQFHQCWSVAPSGPQQGGDCSTFDAQTCSQHDDCVALHAVGSPIGSFTACAAESALQDPGSCVGAVTCAIPAPECPDSTLAGRRNGCWTGYCIPYANCDELPACSSLNEMDCISRSDCAPTYEGENCTCNASSCTCASWTFDVCKMK